MDLTAYLFLGSKLLQSYDFPFSRVDEADLKKDTIQNGLDDGLLTLEQIPAVTVIITELPRSGG